MSEKLLLPRLDEEGVPYLSYSQINKWNKKRRDYIRQYFLGEKEDNEGLQKYGDFGHKVGEAFENNDYSEFEPDEIKFLKTVPKYDEFEREVKLKMDGFYLKGMVDTNTKPKRFIKKIADYKTGDVTQKGSSQVDYSSDDYKQLEIYCAALRQEFGIAPEQATVYLIGRVGNAFNGEELKLTKELLPIEREITEEKLDSVEKEIQETAEEISEYYKLFLKLNQKI